MTETKAGGVAGRADADEFRTGGAKRDVRTWRVADLGHPASIQKLAKAIADGRGGGARRGAKAANGPGDPAAGPSSGKRSADQALANESGRTVFIIGAGFSRDAKIPTTPIASGLLAEQLARRLELLDGARSSSDRPSVEMVDAILEKLDVFFSVPTEKFFKKKYLSSPPPTEFMSFTCANRDWCKGRYGVCGDVVDPRITSRQDFQRRACRGNLYYGIYNAVKRLKKENTIRNDLTEFLVGRSKNSINHASLVLGRLLADDYVHSVVTLNFDALVLEGATHSGVLPKIIDDVVSFERVQKPPDHPRIIWFHGSEYNYLTLHGEEHEAYADAPTDQDDIPAHLTIKHLLDGKHTDTLVIVGLSGGDTSLMTPLRKAIEERRRHCETAADGEAGGNPLDVFWCFYDAPPSFEVSWDAGGPRPDPGAAELIYRCFHRGGLLDAPVRDEHFHLVSLDLLEKHSPDEWRLLSGGESPSRLGADALMTLLAAEIGTGEPTWRNYELRALRRTYVPTLYQSAFFIQDVTMRPRKPTVKSDGSDSEPRRLSQFRVTGERFLIPRDPPLATELQVGISPEWSTIIRTPFLPVVGELIGTAAERVRYEPEPLSTLVASLPTGKLIADADQKLRLLARGELSFDSIELDESEKQKNRGALWSTLSDLRSLVIKANYRDAAISNYSRDELQIRLLNNTAMLHAFLDYKNRIDSRHVWSDFFESAIEIATRGHHLGQINELAHHEACVRINYVTACIRAATLDLNRTVSRETRSFYRDKIPKLLANAELRIVACLKQMLDGQITYSDFRKTTNVELMSLSLGLQWNQVQFLEILLACLQLNWSHSHNLEDFEAAFSERSDDATDENARAMDLGQLKEFFSTIIVQISNATSLIVDVRRQTAHSVGRAGAAALKPDNKSDLLTGLKIDTVLIERHFHIDNIRTRLDLVEKKCSNFLQRTSNADARAAMMGIIAHIREMRLSVDMFKAFLHLEVISMISFALEQAAGMIESKQIGKPESIASPGERRGVEEQIARLVEALRNDEAALALLHNPPQFFLWDEAAARGQGAALRWREVMIGRFYMSKKTRIDRSARIIEELRPELLRPLRLPVAPTPPHAAARPPSRAKA